MGWRPNLMLGLRHFSGNHQNEFNPHKTHEQLQRTQVQSARTDIPANNVWNLHSTAYCHSASPEQLGLLFRKRVKLGGFWKWVSNNRKLIDRQGMSVRGWVSMGYSHLVLRVESTYHYWSVVFLIVSAKIILVRCSENLWEFSLFWKSLKRTFGHSRNLKCIQAIKFVKFL